MSVFLIALAVSAVVGVAYIALAARSFFAIRTRVLAGAPDGLGSDAVFAAQGHGFNWKAAVGVIVATTVLSLLALGPFFFYVIPFLAIGSAIAVVVAFVIDPVGEAS
ncbi:hypothetical protein HJD18_01340 [Thermoleophilia bacterium SCSIO 60948]|nr:hypothetical protein HJD18_01340 [Thermoleophilia bacterium SCSIO 60948]